MLLLLFQVFSLVRVKNGTGSKLSEWFMLIDLLSHYIFYLAVFFKNTQRRDKMILLDSPDLSFMSYIQVILWHAFGSNLVLQINAQTNQLIVDALNLGSMLMVLTESPITLNTFLLSIGFLRSSQLSVMVIIVDQLQMSIFSQLRLNLWVSLSSLS